MSKLPTDAEQIVRLVAEVQRLGKERDAALIAETKAQLELKAQESDFNRNWIVLDDENARLREELEFYHTLTVSRDKDVTSIDDGGTARKLHELWESEVRLRDAMRAANEIDDCLREAPCAPGRFFDAIVLFREHRTALEVEK